MAAAFAGCTGLAAPSLHSTQRRSVWCDGQCRTEASCTSRTFWIVRCARAHPAHHLTHRRPLAIVALPAEVQRSLTRLREEEAKTCVHEAAFNALLGTVLSSPGAVAASLGAVEESLLALLGRSDEKISIATHMNGIVRQHLCRLEEDILSFEEEVNLARQCGELQHEELALVREGGAPFGGNRGGGSTDEDDNDGDAPADYGRSMLPAKTPHDGGGGSASGEKKRTPPKLMRRRSCCCLLTHPRMCAYVCLGRTSVARAKEEQPRGGGRRREEALPGSVPGREAQPEARTASGHVEGSLASGAAGGRRRRGGGVDAQRTGEPAPTTSSLMVPGSRAAGEGDGRGGVGLLGSSREEATHSTAMAIDQDGCEAGDDGPHSGQPGATGKRATGSGPRSSSLASGGSGDPLYCYCNRTSSGEMIACDDADCAIEWFHCACVGLSAPPPGQWYCPDCVLRSAKQAMATVPMGEAFGREALAPSQPVPVGRTTGGTERRRNR